MATLYNSTEEYIKGFRTYLRLERGMSLNTYNSYSSDVKEFASWLDSESGPGVTLEKPRARTSGNTWAPALTLTKDRR